MHEYVLNFKVDAVFNSSEKQPPTPEHCIIERSMARISEDLSR